MSTVPESVRSLCQELIHAKHACRSIAACRAGNTWQNVAKHQQDIRRADENAASFFAAYPQLLQDAVKQLDELREMDRAMEEAIFRMR